MRPHKVRKYNDRKFPHLKYVVNYYEGGKRKRKFFETKDVAKTFAGEQDIESHNKRVAGELPTALRFMAKECSEALSAFGKTIKEATDFFIAHLKASEKSCTAVQLVSELIAAKTRDGASIRHLQDLRHRLDAFAKKFDGQPIATITTPSLDDWLRSLPVAPVTRNHYRRLIVLAFNFAVERGYAATNPAERTAEAREPKSRPGILSVEQAAALLVNAAPEIVPYVAIGLFAGLRRAEIERLDWSEIDFDSGHIEVTAEKSKSKIANRYIAMQPNLREWLLPYRKVRGSVTPREAFRFRELFDQARVAAGITRWPDNALRHSFASYHLAHFKDAKALALEMGHADSAMLFNHYRALVKSEAATRYWSIRPEVTKAVIQFTKAF